MSDLISKQVVLKEIERLMGVYFDRKVVLSKVWDAVDALPSEQETHEERTETHACDLISRADAIDVLIKDCMGSDEGMLNMYDIVCDLKDVPSAKSVDKDINVPDNDTISRQGVLRLLNAVPSEEFATKAMLISGVKALPSAQPNLDEWCRDCKEYDKERHSCPRWNKVIRHTVEDLKAEAQPERKKGTWVLREDLYGSTEAKCSECGFETLVNEEGNGLHEVSDLHYCPNCGADMRGDDHGTD